MSLEDMMESWNSVLIVQAFLCILGHGRLEVLQSWLRWLRRPLWRLEFLQRLRQVTCTASIHPQNLSNHIQTEKKKRFKTPMFHAICKLRSRFWQHQHSLYVMAISSNFIIARVLYLLMITSIHQGIRLALSSKTIPA